MGAKVRTVISESYQSSQVIIPVLPTFLVVGCCAALVIRPFFVQHRKPCIMGWVATLAAFVCVEEDQVTPAVSVRRARLSDADAIAAFVNNARQRALGTLHVGDRVRSPVSRDGVAQRFGQVGLMLAESDGRLVGVLGWQVENLVVRVVDLLVASPFDPLAIGRALVDTMETESVVLVAEAVLVFLPNQPSAKLVAFWQQLGYAMQGLARLPRPWREAVTEHSRDGQEVMVKRLRDDVTYRPM